MRNEITSKNKEEVEYMDKLEDFLKYSVLFSYYGELFPKKKRQYLELYLEENSSLSEIAEQCGVTRQAVFDNEYENKLGIFEKEKELKCKLEHLRKNFTKENLEKIIEDFEYTE